MPNNAKPSIKPGTEPTTRDRGSQTTLSVPSTPPGRTDAQIKGASVGSMPNEEGTNFRQIPADKTKRFVTG